MTGETVFVFALIGVAGALMASNRVRFDVVALFVVLALFQGTRGLFTGWLKAVVVGVREPTAASRRPRRFP